MVYSNCQCLSAFSLTLIAWWPSDEKEQSSWLSAPAAFIVCRLNRLFFSPFGVWGRMWNSFMSVPDHCLFTFFETCLTVYFLQAVLFNNFIHKITSYSSIEKPLDIITVWCMIDINHIGCTISFIQLFKIIHIARRSVKSQCYLVCKTLDVNIRTFNLSFYRAMRALQKRRTKYRTII